MKSILLVAATLFFFGANAQNQQKAPWPEMTAFHEVMSKTFHPMEKGDFNPIRTRSQEMADKALAWKNSTPPAGYDKNAVKPQLKQLVKDTKKLNKQIQNNATDAEIKTALMALHDLFHAITEKCEGGEEH